MLTELQDQRRLEFEAILNTISFECLDLIDDIYLAWVLAGRPTEFEERYSFGCHAFVGAMKREKLTFEEKRGALKVLRRFLIDLETDLKVDYPSLADELRAKKHV